MLKKNQWEKNIQNIKKFKLHIFCKKKLTKSCNFFYTFCKIKFRNFFSPFSFFSAFIFKFTSKKLKIYLKKIKLIDKRQIESDI